jgi:hypothetical protein
LARKRAAASAICATRRLAPSSSPASNGTNATV